MADQTRANVAVWLRRNTMDRQRDDTLAHRRWNQLGTGEAKNMGRPILGVDIDGVLAQQHEALIDAVWRATAGRVRLTYEACTAYDFSECQGPDGNQATAEEWQAALWLYGSPGSLVRLPVVPGAAEGLRRLAERYDIRIVTSRRPEARDVTLAWLAGWADPAWPLVMGQARRKHELPGLAALVEDDHAQAVLCGAAGIRCWLLAHPWNVGRPAMPGVSWAAGWPELTQSLLSRVEGAA